MEENELRQAKAQCLSDIARNLPNYVNRLAAIDNRLVAYIQDAISNDGSHANLYELLGIRKALRLMDSYEVNAQRVQMVIRAIEGQWKNGKHIKGGLKFDTPRGNMHVRQMPYQVWCLFGIYGFTVEVDMERTYNEGDELLPSEFVRDGRVFDKRRLTTEADLFQTRKSGKTEEGAAVDFVEACFLGPLNAQALICAGSRDQAKIAFKAVKEFAYQIDPTCLNRMGGKFLRVTADEINWQPGQRRKGEIKVMSAGGKRKDGLYASVVHIDEHGQEGYTNGHSNIQELADVCVGSMGPRREKLTLHTTTAGLVSEGPYKSQLEVVEMTLLDELNFPLGQPHRTPNDYRFSFLLRLDPWETNYDLEQLDNPELFRKVNRSIGITVQPTWYKERLHAARNSEDTRKEVLTKDFNLWQTNRVQHWINGSRIRPLQTDKKIESCRYDEGWQIYVGLDFSHGDDLFAITYLGVNYTRSQTMTGRFFADMDAWVLEETMKQSPNRPLYEQWIAEGWLHVCPGEVFDSMLAINALVAKMYEPNPTTRLPDTQRPRLNFVSFGYDPAQNRAPINQLTAWLQTLFQARHDLSPRDMSQVIERMVISVSQTAMSLNPIIAQLEDLIKTSDQWIQFSNNPMWPWQFGNCACEINNNDLRRIIKGGPIPTHKIDNVMGLLDALWCFSQTES